MPRLKIPEKAGAKCMLHIFCAREPQHALMGAICWPGIFPRGISGGLFDAFRGHPKRRDPLRILRFCEPHFQIFGAARQNMYKKEGRCAGPTPRFQALPSGHLCRGLFSSIFRVKFATTRKNFFLYTVEKQKKIVLCCPSFHPFPLPSVPSYRGNFWRF